MARLTWDQVQGGNFSGANEAARMATNLLGTASMPLIAGIEGFQEAVTAKQSGDLRQRVLALQDPAAMAAALGSGSIFNNLNSRYLSPDAQEFAAGQTQRLLDEDQTVAETGRIGAATGLLGVQTQRGAYDLDRLRTVDGRADALYEAKQAAEPLRDQITALANSGDLIGAQNLARANIQVLRDADISLSSIFRNIKTEVTGGQNDYIDMRAFSETLRSNDLVDDARGIVELGASQFSTLEDFTQAMDYAVQTNQLTPAQAQAAIAEATATEAFRGPSRAEELGIPYEGDNTWLGGFQNRMEMRESGGESVVNDVGIAAGRAQLTQPRMQDLIDAGVLPPGTTVDNFTQLSEEQQAAANDYHFQDLANTYERNGYDRYVGQVINGVTVTREGIMAAAHLSGWGGVDSYLAGESDRQDAYGTNVSDYMSQFGNMELPAGMGQVPGGLDFGSAVPQTDAERAADAMQRAAAEQTAEVDALVADTAAALATTSQQAVGGLDATGAPTVAAPTAPRAGDAAAAAAARREMTPEEEAGLASAMMADPAMTSTEQGMLDNNIARNQRAGTVQEQIDTLAAQADKIWAAERAKGYRGWENQAAALTRPINEQIQALQADLATQSTAPIPQVAQQPVAATQPADHDYGNNFFADNAQIGSLLGEGIVNTVADVGTSLNRTLNPVIEYMFGAQNFFGDVPRLDMNNDGYGSSPLGALAGFSDTLAPEERAAVNARDGVTPNVIAVDPTTGQVAAPQPLEADGTMRENIGPVTAERLQQDLRMIDSTLAADQMFNGTADLTAVVADLPNTQNEREIAAALVAEGGPMSGMDIDSVGELVIKIAREADVPPRMAGALLGKTFIDMGDDGEGWFNLAEDPSYDAQMVSDVFEQFVGEDANPREIRSAIASQIRDAELAGEASADIQEIRTEYEGLVEEMNALLADPRYAGRQEEIINVFNTRHFPNLRARLARINNSGITTNYTDALVDQ
jgi:hypothetical protein